MHRIALLLSLLLVSPVVLSQSNCEVGFQLLEGGRTPVPLATIDAVIKNPDGTQVSVQDNYKGEYMPLKMGASMVARFQAQNLDSGDVKALCNKESQQHGIGQIIMVDMSTSYANGVSDHAYRNQRIDQQIAKATAEGRMDMSLIGTKMDGEAIAQNVAAGIVSWSELDRVCTREMGVRDCFSRQIKYIQGKQRNNATRDF